MSQTCCLCQSELEFLVPSNLCEDHWQKWFNHKLSLEETEKLNQVRKKNNLPPTD